MAKMNYITLGVLIEVYLLLLIYLKLAKEQHSLRNDFQIGTLPALFTRLIIKIVTFLTVELMDFKKVELMPF